MRGRKLQVYPQASHLCRLIVNALEMAEEKDGVYIQPLLPHYDVIVYLGQDEKSSVPVGRSVPLTAVGNQSDRGTVGQDQRVVTADYDWGWREFCKFLWMP